MEKTTKFVGEKNKYHNFNLSRVFKIIIGSIGTLLWNSIRLHRSVRNRELPPDCKRVGIRVWGTLSVFLRKNFVSLCALLFSLAFFFFGGFVVAVSFRLCWVFVFGKRIRRILESPRKKRSRKRKGKVEGEILLFFWLRYAIRIRDSLFYFVIVKKVKRVEVLGEIWFFFLVGWGFLLGEIDSRDPSDDLIFFLRKI